MCMYREKSDSGNTVEIKVRVLTVALLMRKTTWGYCTTRLVRSKRLMPCCQGQLECNFLLLQPLLPHPFPSLPFITMPSSLSSPSSQSFLLSLGAVLVCPGLLLVGFQSVDPTVKRNKTVIIRPLIKCIFPLGRAM